MFARGVKLSEFQALQLHPYLIGTDLITKNGIDSLLVIRLMDVIYFRTSQGFQTGFHNAAVI